MKNSKILVVGAGIAGAAVCYWLKKYGFSPQMIEKSSLVRKGGFAIDIRGVAVGIAQKMGVYHEIVSRRTQLKLGQYVDENGDVLSSEEGERFGFREGDDVELLRGDLAEILVDAVSAVPLKMNTHLVAVEQGEDAVKVVYNDGRTEFFDLVIGADGLHSSIRKQVFQQKNVNILDLGCYISVFDIPNFLNLDRTEILFEKERKIVHVNSDRDPNHARAGFMFRSDKKLKEITDQKEQKRFLKDTFQGLGWETDRLLGLLEKSDDLYFDSIAQVKMETWTDGRVALLGDAGYCASPLSGQGTSLALVGAYVLAGELLRSEGHYHDAFSEYNKIMRGFVDENQAFGQWVSETFLLDEVSQEETEARTALIMEKLAHVSRAITLPNYEGRSEQ